MSKKVFFCRLSQESNSFNPDLADFSSFKIVTDGVDVLTENGKAGITVNGIYKTLNDKGYELIPGIFMQADSGAPIKNQVIEYFTSETISKLKTISDLDGVCISMHGATLSDVSDDVCGDILEAIRNQVGEKVVISVSFDLHANVTEKTLKNADYVSGYQTYPHLDLYEVGVRAAQRIIDHFENGKAFVARAEIPVIAPAHAYTTSTGELKKLMDKAKAYKDSGKILDYSIFQAQPWLDAKQIFATVIITGYDEQTVLDITNELAIDEFNLKENLQGSPLISINKVIEKALNNKSGKPVVLCDSADSPNAGANGDSATVLEYLLPYQDKLKCALAVVDKSAVDKAYELGVGKTGDFVLGGSIAKNLSKPVIVKNATVKVLSDGDFYAYGPQERGQLKQNGKSALIAVGKIYIHISYAAKTIGDKGFFRSVGVEPELMDLVCVKACTSFRAGYEPISSEICNAQTTGAAGTNLKLLPFEKRPKPLYPFEEISFSDIKQAKIYR